MNFDSFFLFYRFPCLSELVLALLEILEDFCVTFMDFTFQL